MNEVQEGIIEEHYWKAILSQLYDASDIMQLEG
jgi:hypothetical protein